MPEPSGTRATKGERSFERDVNAALDDTVVLLEFLGQSSDGRLQSHFRDTRDQVSGISPRVTSPPCNDYRQFLNRLSAIQNKLMVDPQWTKTDSFSVQKIGEPPLSDWAFLLWARDFLAGVAAPATADTIRLTKAYMRRRSERLWRRNAITPSARDETIEGAASKLARRVYFLNVCTLIFTFATIAVSVYALSGRLIISARDDQINRMREIESKIFDIESHTTNPVIVNHILREAESQAGTPPGPRSSRPEGQSGPPIQINGASSGRPEVDSDWDRRLGDDGLRFYLCDNIGRVTDTGVTTASSQSVSSPSFGPIPNGHFFVYGSYESIEICKQRQRTLEQLFAIGEQLLSWERVVTGPWRLTSAAGSQHLTWWSTSLDGKIFGKDKKVIDEFGNNPDICRDFVGAEKGQCVTALMEIVEYYGKVPDSILGCITFYLLPCLYGLLGSMAATMAYVRRRVDSYEVNFTAKGVILQNCILGILAGAIVGLFSAYLAKSSTVENIGVSALACLAGYNVSALFAFLDNLSNRVFRGEGSNQIKRTS